MNCYRNLIHHVPEIPISDHENDVHKFLHHAVKPKTSKKHRRYYNMMCEATWQLENEISGNILTSIWNNNEKLSQPYPNATWLISDKR